MFHFDKNYGLFIGKLIDNKFHKHYALQLSISLNEDMSLSVKNEEEVLSKALFINSQVEHKLISKSKQLTILINPLSSIGHQLHLKYSASSYLKLEGELAIKLSEILNDFILKKITFENLCNLISQVLFQYQCNCESENHLGDDRVLKALNFMDTNFEKVLSVEEVAEQCFLSPSRFLHLFKEKTNLTFRRYQLGNKIVKSLPYLRNNSVTETAYMYGFSDSSHYTRTFQETFGVTPKFLFQK